MHRFLLSLPLFAVLASAAEPAKPTEPKKENPFTPGGIYRKGDMLRPRPTVITPPTATTAPSDANVLFDGKDLSKFIRKPRKDDKDQSDVPNWKIENGYAEITPKGGEIETRDKFGSCQIHLEWATPAEVVGKSQGRGNSGVLIHGWGEVQVLDSYENDTYPDGQAGAIYSNYPPLVNASLQPARITVLHNGVIVQHAVPLDTKVQEFGFALQDHHNPTRYRNIWVRPLHRYDENAKKDGVTK